MSTIEEQLELERDMVMHGINRYNLSQNRCIEKGREAQTTAASRLMAAHISAVAEGIDKFLNERRGRNITGELLKGCDAEKLAYFTLYAVFQQWSHQRPVQSVAMSLGQMVEDDIRFTRFRAKHTGYYDAVMVDFKRKGTENYRHKHRVLTALANGVGDGWNSWTATERVHVGTKLLSVVISCTDLVQRGSKPNAGKRPSIILDPTPTVQEWLARHAEHMSMLSPATRPCVIPPADWEGPRSGGYYLPELRHRVPVVMNMKGPHERILRQNPPLATYAALNDLQRTPWRINKKIFSVFKEVWDRSLGIGMPRAEPYEIPTCPLPPSLKKGDMTDDQRNIFEDWKAVAAATYTMEAERKAKCFQAAQTMRLASEYKDRDRFWYVWRVDSRNRKYPAVAGLSPQGMDPAKGLLEFAEGKPLGKDGLRQLKLAAAGYLGNDKISYADREAFIDAKMTEIKEIAKNPLGHRQWAEADKPWQYLACCFELAAADGSEEFVSHLPVPKDGSCNGLQHFSAMLRDPIGGQATNLTYGDVPADIYSQVARLTLSRLRMQDCEIAEAWLDYIRLYHNNVIPRKIAKPPVMTMPYGSTKQACTATTLKFLLDHHPEFWKEHGHDTFFAARYLTPLIWDSIGETVVAAREAMDWLRKVGGLVSKNNKPLVWTTPHGFTVYQSSKKIEQVKVWTALFGQTVLRVGVYSDQMDNNKMRNGSAPNYVHSMDSTHMDMVINAMPENTHFAMVHDSFGCHACDIATLDRVIREQFAALYETNPMDTLHEQLSNEYGKHVPPVPNQGSLRITEVLDSPYFFG